MDLTFTLADLTATSACELRLYTELRERAQKQSARPTPEKSERAREAYRECLRALTAGGMVGSGVVGAGVVGGEHAGGTARPVPLVATSAAGLTYTVELDRLDCPAADSAAESNTARIVCTPHLGEAAHRALLRGALAAHLLTASATESAENAARLDLHLEHGVDEYGTNEYSAGSESESTEHHSPVPQPHRVDSARILPLIRLQEQRLLLLTEALNEGVEPAELAERIPYFLTCGECPACLNAAASLALATEAPELVTEDTAEDTAENPETEEHPVMYRVPAAVENDSEQYRLQCLLDAQLASLEEHAAEHGWGAGELEAAMLLSMTNYHRRERAPFWREHIRRLEDGPTAWVASRDYAYLDRVQVLSAEHAHALLNTPADLEALAAAMKEPAEVEDAPGWYRVRGAQVRLLRARIEADPSLVIAPSDRAVFCAYEAGLSPQIALDRMESQVNYFRASNPGERVPAELAATGFFFGVRVLAVAQGGFGAGSEDSADPEETAEESTGAESAGEFLEVLLQERIRVKDEPHGALPSGIGPGDPVSTATIEAALQADVHALLFGGALMPSDPVLNGPVPGEDSGASDASSSSRALPSVLDAAASLTGVKSASTDLLFRRAPRLKKGASNAKNTENAENLPREVDFPGSALPTVDAVHAAVRALDHSYVAVQGPPGAGKTFLASHVIARLVAEGAKVGVVAQSHAVIENLMAACCARESFDVSRAVRLRGKSVTPDAPWSEVSDSELVELISGAGGLLFGGTVWDYVSERRVPAGSLDVLVVDEAGQFSLTNTVAAARAARSVLLLGDPQQLPQVSTGVHPYPVDVSALGWLSDGAAALDPRFGYFLGESWRMDSALCERVSWLSYDGALASAAATAGRALQGVAPGVVSYPVEHAGCSVRSVQEAQAVVDCVRELLGREWVPAAGAEPRPLAAEDCIVVAAYNAQVDCVREALIAAGLADSSGAGVRVGTVDKFQGQEAAVVLVSLASSRVDSGRGAGFVLSPNRLNVAVSRGQWQAVLVHSPWVARSVPQDVEEVLALSGFAGLVE